MKSSLFMYDIMYEWCGFVSVWNVHKCYCTKVLWIVYGYATYLKCCGVSNERAYVVMEIFIVKLFFCDFKCLRMLAGIPG